MTVCGSLFAMLDMCDPFLSTCLMKQLDDVLFEKKNYYYSFKFRVWDPKKCSRHGN